MNSFKTLLYVELMVSHNGANLTNRDGLQLWKVKKEFIYESDVAKQTFKVPEEFITDFASVPRIPIVYDSLGNLFQRSAVIHDFLYSTAPIPRLLADNVLLEAMQLDGISWFKRKLVYAGVRVGGGSHYGKSS